MTHLSDEVVERVARALDLAALAHGTNDVTFIATEDAPALARAALEAARYGELRVCLKRLEAASTTIAGRLDMLGPETEIGEAIKQARALLSDIDRDNERR